jgi:hypothetical protein
MGEPETNVILHFPFSIFHLSFVIEIAYPIEKGIEK